MTRIPLGDLKVAFSNPAKYVRSFATASGGGGPTKYGMFLHAIGEFHKTNDLAKAQSYLETALKKFKTTTELPDYTRKLDRYVREWRRQDNPLVRYRDNITIPVPEEFSRFVVSGQASRVDLVRSGGYAIWMFVRAVPDWEDDPKMPLLQYTYALSLDIGMDSVNVGTYDLNTGVYAARRYSAREVGEARRGLNGLLEALSARFPIKA